MVVFPSSYHPPGAELNLIKKYITDPYKLSPLQEFLSIKLKALEPPL